MNTPPDKRTQLSLSASYILVQSNKRMFVLVSEHRIIVRNTNSAGVSSLLICKVLQTKSELVETIPVIFPSGLKGSRLVLQCV